MFEEIGPQFLSALAAAAAPRLSPEHPLLVACGEADLSRVREALDALAPAEADALLAQAHKLMREDEAGVLAQWRPARRSPPN